ncbi:MAG TPA: PilZ domain-containing protein [Anaeromyxobacter sp.]
MTFIENPRRAPRAPVRCEGRIALREGGYFPSQTSDYGPRGCQVVLPQAVPAGQRVFVELRNERIDGPVELSGRVAWVAKEPPWRMGVAFDPGSVPFADRFFERLAAAYPGIDTYGQAPDRIPEEAPLAPASPPEFDPLLTDDEELVLVTIGAGLTAAALRARLGAKFGSAQNALFSLLGRRYVSVGPPTPGAAAAWARILRPS